LPPPRVFASAPSSAFAPLKPAPQRSPPLAEPLSGRAAANPALLAVAAARAALESAAARRQAAADRQLECLVAARRRPSSRGHEASPGSTANDAGAGGSNDWSAAGAVFVARSRGGVESDEYHTQSFSSGQPPRRAPEVPHILAQMPRAEGHGSPPPLAAGEVRLEGSDSERADSPILWRRTPSPAASMRPEARPAPRYGPPTSVAPCAQCGGVANGSAACLTCGWGSSLEA
jgi:hypothetical protein